MQPSWRYRPTRVTRKVNIGNFIRQMSGDIAPNKGVCGVPVFRPMKGFLNGSNRSFVVHISRFCQVENQLSCSQVCWCIKNGNIIPLLSNTNVATNAGQTFIYFYENKGSVLILWKYQSAGKCTGKCTQPVEETEQELSGLLWLRHVHEIYYVL